MTPPLARVSFAFSRAFVSFLSYFLYLSNCTFCMALSGVEMTETQETARCSVIASKRDVERPRMHGRVLNSMGCLMGCCEQLCEDGGGDGDCMGKCIFA